MDLLHGDTADGALACKASTQAGGELPCKRLTTHMRCGVAGFDAYLTEGLMLRPGDGNGGYIEGALTVPPGGIPVLFNTNNDTMAGGAWMIDWDSSAPSGWSACLLASAAPAGVVWSLSAVPCLSPPPPHV